MRLLSKSLPILLISILAASALIIIYPVTAQSASKPSVPEFTLKYSDYSHSIPPTYGTDQYTGQKITLSEGYDVINRTVQFTIKNQPFKEYTDSNGNPIGLYYHIRYKGSYGNNWSDFSVKEGNSIIFHDTLVFPASNSSTSQVNVGEYSFAGNGLIGDKGPYNINLPTDGKIDFQVQALIGTAQLFNANWVLGDFAVYYYNFTGQVGDWSNTQTLTFGNTSLYTTTPNPTFPNLTLAPTTNSTSTISFNYSFSLDPTVFVVIIAVLIGVIVALAVSLFIMKQKRRAEHA
jgi:hypothetical protein